MKRCATGMAAFCLCIAEASLSAEAPLMQNLRYDASMGTSAGIVVVQVSDGPSRVVTVDDRRAIQSDSSGRHIYFSVDNVLTVNGRHMHIEIRLTYLDQGQGHLVLQYDSCDESAPHAGQYKTAGRIRLEDTREWRKETFKVTDAYLGDRQHNGADFRLARTGEEAITVARVEVDLLGAERRPAHVPATVLGATHAAGKYFFDEDSDFLNEGAAELSRMGFRVIKVWMIPENPAGHYPWNSTWPEKFDSLREMAAHRYYRELWRRPFETYVLTITGGPTFRQGYPDPFPEQMEREFYDLASFFLTEYDGTGKTFILGTWESDWQLRGTFDTSPEHDPDETTIAGMIRWYRARQQGVTRARRDHPGSDVHVYAAAEVNLVELAMADRPAVTNRVLPKLNMDLVSVSAWGITLPMAEDERRGRRIFREALDYLARMTPDTPVLSPAGKPFGNRNIFISEFGLPEQARGVVGSAQLERLTRSTIEEAYAWGCPWIIFWQLYDNECCAPGDDPCNPVGGPNPGAAPATKREHCRGYWLRRVDGSTSPAWGVLREAMRPLGHDHDR